MKYAILSDIHANYEALTAVLNKCSEIGVTDFISLGDIVGYNANPKECIDLIRSLNLIAAVKGNHDEYVSNDDEVMEGFNPHARAAVLWTKAQLSEEDRAWLAGLPMRLTVRGTSITIVHATLDSPDTWGYIFDLHQAADNFTYQFTQLCFCGHSHVPLAFCKKPVALRADKPIDEIPDWSGADMEIPLSYQCGKRRSTTQPGSPGFFRRFRFRCKNCDTVQNSLRFAYHTGKNPAGWSPRTFGKPARKR